MKRKFFTILFLFLMMFSISEGNEPNERVAWWQEARFGMFIHWGLYSVPGRGEWLFYQEHVPIEEYSKLADEFNMLDSRDMWHPHPAFGPFTKEQWGQLQYKHLDHHLKQFGV